jgi:AraC family transcriptional regulator
MTGFIRTCYNSPSLHQMTVMIQGRISVIRKGTFEPLYASGPSVHSPSPSFLVESQRKESGETCTREFTSHVLTYFPTGATVLHGGEGRCTQRIHIPQQGVVVSLRSQVESVEWIEAADQLSVQIDVRVLSLASEALWGRAGIELAPSPGFLAPRLSGLLDVLNAEAHAGYPSGRLFVDGIEQAMTSYLDRHAAGRSDLPPIWSSRGGLAPGVARRLTEYMQDNLAAEISMIELATVADLSASHLSRAFRITFRSTPHEFLLSLRVTRAKALLQDAGPSILDVAQRCGFKTQQHFSRVFSQRVGLSPGRFRRAL